MKVAVWFVYLYLSGILGCTKQMATQSLVSITVPPGEDIADFVTRNQHYNEFLLVTGEYQAGRGTCITRSRIVIRKKSLGDEPRITETMQICGDDNVLDGLTWDADKDTGIRRSDPGTLAISGRGNTVRNCIFRNFRTTQQGPKIIMIGRLFVEGKFINTVADNNTIESNTFDNWGTREEPRGSTKSSTCIAVGLEDDKGKFTGTVIRKNLFINGPYRQYGYNAALKIFNAVLLEDNNFFGGQECMEMKYGNSTIRGNVIHHFSGYSILGDRYGRNNLYEYNTVYDVAPIDSLSSSQGFMVWECGNTVLRNNLIYDCQTLGRIPGRQTPNNTLMEYLLIEHNSFINDKRGIHFEDKTGSPRHLIITKNIFVDGGSTPVWALSNVDTASLEYYADNLYYGAAREKGDGAPVTVNPLFSDTARQDFRLSDHSAACGYGAFPCGMANEGGPDDLAHYVVIYPTRDKWVFHVGLVGLDIEPGLLEIEDLSGRPLLKRTSPEPGFKLFSHIDLRGSHLPDYILRLHTNKTVITKRVHIE